MPVKKKIGGIRETCIARNGERCKDCVYYGHTCEMWKRAHRMYKPCDTDPCKNDIMRAYTGGATRAAINDAKRTMKGANNNGYHKEKRNHNRSNKA